MLPLPKFLFAIRLNRSQPIFCMKSFCRLAFVFGLSCAFSTPQPSGKIYFRNPSFEGPPGAGKSPAGWQSGTPGSTPDIMPGAWGIDFAPQEGSTCIGLVTREDGTREDISQALAEPLKGGNCYKFTISLAHAASYVGYNKPIRLRVWGGSSKSERAQLLSSSPLIEHADWRTYKFECLPARDVRYLTFEAYFAPGVTFKYKGNILLDNCSPIEKCERA